MKRVFFLIAIFLFIPSSVFAMSISQHTLDTNYDWNPHENGKLLGQSFQIPFAGDFTVNSVTVVGKKIDGSGGSLWDMTAYIITKTASGDSVCGGGSQNWSTGDPQFFTYNFSSCFLSGLTDYVFIIESTHSLPLGIRTYGANLNYYADGELNNVYLYSGATTFTPNTTILDLYFDLNYTSGVPVVNFIRRTTPIPNFNNWILQFQIPTSSQAEAIADWRMGVDYSFGGNSYEDYGYFSSSTINNEAVKIPKLTTLTSSTIVTAVAYIKNGWTGEVIASSTSYIFTVDDNPTSDYGAWQSEQPTSTISVTGNGDCSQVNGWVDKGLCYTYQGLFVPSDAIMAQYVQMKDVIATKVPFGYFTLYQQSINGLSLSTSTTSTVSGIQSDFDTNLSALGSFWLVTTLRDWVFTPVLYLLVAFYVYYRFKHFVF